jgi:hypothetical protein
MTMTDRKPAAEPATRRTYRFTVDIEATLASGPVEGSAGPSWDEAVHHPAVRLWQSLGFRIIGTIPEAFEHPELGRVGLHIMHRRL